MRISSMKITGFRCFDHAGQTIELADLTCFVGPNASGKTAAMLALARLFGETRAQRRVVPADFHLQPGEKLQAKKSRQLFVECRLEFPELQQGEESDAVPETFKQMLIDEPGGEPFCRIRLEANWIDDGTPSGDVEQTASWILTTADDPQQNKLLPSDRSRIRLIYVPAARDPKQQIRATATTAFGRLLDALSWEGADESLTEQLEVLQHQISELLGIRTLSKGIQKSWSSLYDGRVARRVNLHAVDDAPDQLLKQLAPIFRPDEGGQTMPASALTDGLRSLFTLSLTMGLHRIEDELRSRPAALGFVEELAQRLPMLTIFAVEEPENHLSPHYLGRVMSALGTHATMAGVQVVLSSHSPSMLGRVEADATRYFRGHEVTASSQVNTLSLPENESDEAYKYVRTAVRGYPELYFSRLVILGEGPSEEVVLRRLLETTGAPLDTEFISIVPLGGRHVNHFWKLLTDLDIPFLTLLDLDKERTTGGWSRIQYVRNQLVALYGASSSELEFAYPDGKTSSLSDEEWDKFSLFDVADDEELESWVTYFRDAFGIFFSSPLDLDFSMLEAFPHAYTSLSARGPRLPAKATSLYADEITRRTRYVLGHIKDSGTSVGSTYTAAQRDLFPWYKHLFLDGSKPATHMRALLAIPTEELQHGAPSVLRLLVQRARELLT